MSDEALNRSCETALSWSTLRSIILSSDLVKLARSEEQKLTYRRGRDTIHSEWDSIYDYLLCKKFGFNEISNESTSKKRSDPTFDTLKSQWDKEPNNSYRMVLCLNDYPYYLEPGIEHWILWKLGGQDVTDDEIDRAKLKLMRHCIEIDCNDDGIDMQMTLPLPTVTPHNEIHNLSEDVKDASIFLQWINPPHLKRFVTEVPVYCLFSSSTRQL
jgi:hypothetical protein